MSMITELIKKLNEHADLLKEMGFDPDGMVMNDYREAADTIQLLSQKLHASQMERSSQYYNDGWIPVSERLPEEREWIGTKQFGTTISDEVYVTFESPKGDRFTKHLLFQNGKLSRADQQMIDVFHEGSVPVAWMPLPQPYQPKKGEEWKH